MKPTIIFVDDDRNVRESVRRSLIREDLRLITVESAQQCVETLAVTQAQVLITDLAMPGFNGQTLVNYFKEIKPEVIRIVLSGKLTPQITKELTKNSQVFCCLSKPCTANLLRSTIRDALKQWSLTSSPTNQTKLTTNTNDTNCCDGSQSSLIRNALKEVELLERALKRHSEQGRPFYTK